MSYLTRLRKAAGVAALASAMATTVPAEAQRALPRSQAAGRAVPRQAVPRSSVPQTIASTQNWQRFQSGLNRTSINFVYSSGIPFYAGIPGGFYGNLWFPIPCLPRRASYFEAMMWQNYNVSRFGPTVWEQRAYRNGYILPHGSGYVLQDDQTNLAEENAELREKLRQRELQDAEKRGYERGLAEIPQIPQVPAQPQPILPEPKLEPLQERFVVRSEYNGSVDKVQYTGEAKEFYNSGLFEGLRSVTNGDINLVAYIESPTRVGIRDANNKMTHLVDIEFGRYPNCINDNDLRDRFVSEIIERINIDDADVYSARALIDIKKDNNYFASTCRPR